MCGYSGGCDIYVALNEAVMCLWLFRRLCLWLLLMCVCLSFGTVMCVWLFSGCDVCVAVQGAVMFRGLHCVAVQGAMMCTWLFRGL